MNASSRSEAPDALEELSMTYNAICRALKNAAPVAATPTALLASLMKLTAYGSKRETLAFDLWRLQDSLKDFKQECNSLGTPEARELKLFTSHLEQRLATLLRSVDSIYLMRARELLMAYYDTFLYPMTQNVVGELYFQQLLKPTAAGYRALHAALLAEVAEVTGTAFIGFYEQTQPGYRGRLLEACDALEVQYLLSGYTLASAEGTS